MASILGNYMRARESAYFKLEQEAAVQQRKSRLVQEGKLPKGSPAPGTSSSRQEQSFEESESTYDILPEVLQAQARIDDPNAARRKEYDLHKYKPESPPLTEAERRRYRTSNSAMGAAVGHVPRLSLSGRNRYGIPQGANINGDLALVTVARGMSPQAMEVASRGYSAGMRAMVYGTLLGIAALAVGGTAAVRALDVGPGGDFRGRMQVWLEPAVGLVKSWVGPLKATAESWGGGAGAGEGGDGVGTRFRGSSELQARLKSRLNPTNY